MTIVNSLTARFKAMFNADIPCWFEYLQDTDAK